MRCCVQLHPDVNPVRDTTEEATALNEAYALLQEVANVLTKTDAPAELPFCLDFFFHENSCNRGTLGHAGVPDWGRGSSQRV